MIKRDDIIPDKQGNQIRIICTDAPGEYPVIGMDKSGVLLHYKLNGRWGMYVCDHDLIIPEDFTSFVKGEPVMVRDKDTYVWQRGYFSYAKDGIAFCFTDGGTEWSSGGDVSDWKQCRRPTPEELGEER